MAVTTLAGQAWAADATPIGPIGAELAACRTAADQPICLLKLEARKRHQSYEANIEIGYAPGVVAAIGPDPSPPFISPILKRLEIPGRAAVQALIADQAGATPAEALAPIRAISAEKAKDPARQPIEDALAASRRIQAYQILWNASRGEPALPIARRPSQPLARAALAAWKSELPQAGKDGRVDELAAALRQSGDVRAAEQLPPSDESGDLGRVLSLLQRGLFDDAAHAVDAMKPTDPAGAVELAMARVAVVGKAMDAGRTDIGLHFARAQLEAWFAELSDPGRRGTAHSGSDVPSSLVLVAQFAPRSEAIKWTERMEVAARQTTPLAAATSAYAAAHAWTRLGEPGRAKAVLAVWPTPSEVEVEACILGMFKASSECRKSTGTLLAILLQTTPLDASWEELSPLTGQMALAKRRAARGIAGVDADLAKATTAEQRFDVLHRCASSAAADMLPSIAAVCAHRLAVEPAPVQASPVGDGELSYGERRLDAVLSAAGQAAQSHDLKTMRDMLDLAFDLAARVPDEQLNYSFGLQLVAIAQLREQGRL